MQKLEKEINLLFIYFIQHKIKKYVESSFQKINDKIMKYQKSSFQICFFFSE